MMNEALAFMAFAFFVWLLPAIVGAIVYSRLKGREGEEG